MLKKMIGLRIKELRISNTNLNQEDFARRIGFDGAYISRVESGKQNLTIENLQIICKGLKVSLSVFFKPFNKNYEVKE